MKKARMNISHSRFILFKLKIFSEIVITGTLFKTPVKRFGKLLVVKIVCESTSYHYGGLGAKPPAAGQFLKFFSEKNSNYFAIWMTF